MKIPEDIESKVTKKNFFHFLSIMNSSSSIIKVEKVLKLPKKPIPVNKKKG